MYTKEYLIENKILDESKSYSHKVIGNFYQEQLDKFEKIGIGNATENDVIVTPELIEITRERLFQIRPILKMGIKEK